MAAVRDPLGRVAAVRSRKEANHLRSELHFSLENEHLAAHQEHEHEEALSLLEDRFPTARRTSRAPAAHTARRRRAAPASAPTRPAPAAPRAGRARGAASQLAASAPTREASRTAGALGDLAAPITDSATEVMLGAARAGLLLALLYLILSARGSRGLAGVLNVATGAMSAFFSAGADPLARLNGSSASTAPAYPVGWSVPVTPANDPSADPSGRPQDVRIVAGLPDPTADPSGRPQDIPLRLARRPLVPRIPVTRSH